MPTSVLVDYENMHSRMDPEVETVVEKRWMMTMKQQNQSKDEIQQENDDSNGRRMRMVVIAMPMMQ